MYFIILMILIGIKGTVYFKALKDKEDTEIFSNKGRKESFSDRFTIFFQLVVTAGVSYKMTYYLGSLEERSFIFWAVFLISNLMIQIITHFILWLQEYIVTVKMNIYFCICIPAVILTGLKHINSMSENLIVLTALIMSLITVYIELIHIISDSNKMIVTENILKKQMKIKSIITWMIIILINLYTLVIFTQFYLLPNRHHFIMAEEPNLYSAIDLLYYLVITFTTVGFGDIHPYTPLAKLITILIAASGMFFSAVFVGTILSLQEKD